MSRTEKKFDAVDMIRSIRDRISAEIEGMPLEEELARLASQEIQDPFLKRLRTAQRDKPIQPATPRIIGDRQSRRELDRYQAGWEVLTEGARPPLPRQCAEWCASR